MLEPLLSSHRDCRERDHIADFPCVCWMLQAGWNVGMNRETERPKCESQLCHSLPGNPGPVRNMFISNTSSWAFTSGMNEMWQVNWTANVCEHLRGSSFPGDNADSWTGSCPLGTKCLVEVVLTETLCSRQRVATNSCYLPFESWSPIPWVKIGLSDFLGQFSVAQVLFWDFKF